MSDVLASVTVSKRKMMACLSSALTVMVGSLSLPRTSRAEDLNTEMDVEGIDTSEAPGVVEKYGDNLGLMICVSFEGSIKAYPVIGGGKTIRVNQANYYPPSPRTTVARTEMRIEVFDESPRHIWVCCPGGENICVQV